MKIGFISQWYEPEPGAAAHPTAVIRALKERGHEVTVLTGIPNYPHGQAYPGYSPYRGQAETMHGMKVHRLPSFLSHDESAVRRAASLLSFGCAATMRSGLLGDVDVCLVYASPATAAMPAMFLSRTKGIPHVLYIQDLWPDTVTASGFLQQGTTTQLVERPLRRACLASYRSAHSIAVIAPRMAQLLEERGVPSSKLDVIYNWVDEEVFTPAEANSDLAEHLRTRGRFILMYAGGVGELQGLEHAVRAMQEFPDGSVHFAIVGEGTAKAGLQRLAEALGVAGRISFWPARPLQEMPAVMACADAQLVSLRDLPLFEATVPSKLQASLACGQPILVAAPGDSRDLAVIAGAGATAAPEDARSIAAAIKFLDNATDAERRHMSERGLAFYRERLSRRAGAGKLEELLLAATAGSGRTR